jgi:soluble lytic murein transglycosylase-like protein
LKIREKNPMGPIPGRARIAALAVFLLSFGVTAEVRGQQVSRSIGTQPPNAASSVAHDRNESHGAVPSSSSAARLRLNDGSSLAVDDAWEDGQGIWYRQGGITRLLERNRVASIDRGQKPAGASAAPARTTARVTNENGAPSQSDAKAVWIYLVRGARVEADDATESPTGVWYQRGSLSIFIERSRIERVERVEAHNGDLSNSAHPGKERGWSTGKTSLDNLIRQNGARYAVDPYLIFCVMEQESHFNTRAVSPKGARGLMQLMPGTGAGLGVRHPYNAAENVAGGTRYLKRLLQNFGGRVDLVLASYNAGEGAVIKYGRAVPPYRETRNYVKRISTRYGQNEVAEAQKRAGSEARREH